MSTRLDINKVLDKNLKRLRAYPNVLSLRVGEKWEDNQRTGKQSITIFVSKKLPLAMMSPLDVLPKEIDGILIDVVELATKDWKVGKTSVSDLPPETQRRMASGVRKI